MTAQKKAPAVNEGANDSNLHPENSTPMAYATRIIATTPQRITKRWVLIDGAPTKQSAGHMLEGAAIRTDVSTPQKLANVLERLKPFNALTFGVTKAHAPRIKCETALTDADKAAGVISRTARHFEWPDGAGWMMLDYDPAPNSDPLSRDAWLARLYKIAPDLATAPMVWSASSSSCIYNSETDEEVTGIRGQRLYILVADAKDIPRAGEVLAARLWLSGWGYIAVSKSGAMLERCDIDASVWQPSRLDFAAKPECVAPLECRRPDPIVTNNEARPLESASAIPELTRKEAKQLKKAKADAKQAAAPESQQKRLEWVTERLAGMECDQTDPDQKEATQRLQSALTDRRLFSDFELRRSNGEWVSVGTLLDDPHRWEGERFYDPLEPEDGTDPRIAIATIKGDKLGIYSHAHGGSAYTLAGKLGILQLDEGDTDAAAKAVCKMFRDDGGFYERAGQICILNENALEPRERHALMTYADRMTEFKRWDGRQSAFKRISCPEQLMQRVMAMPEAWQLPKVSGVVSFPVMRSDGTVIERAGYDKETGLLVLPYSGPAADVLRGAQLRATLARIWKPFAEFPFTDDLARGVFLSALLTTVTRAAMPTAPAFLVRATTAGTGKTLLSECLMMLAGASPAAMPLPVTEEERVKVILAKLVRGDAGVLFDNVDGMIDGPALCVNLTSAQVEGRILGLSKIVSVQNTALWILNGNNVTAGGDTFRRILPITLDANCERPELREFDHNPRQYIAENLNQYRADLLSVLMTYQHEDAPRVGAGGLGSFDDWEAIVRQCVCWVIREGVAPAGMADPVGVLELSASEDPKKQAHGALLESWYAHYRESPVLVKDLVNLANGGRFVHVELEAANVQMTDKERAAADFSDALREVGTPYRGRAIDARYLAGYLRRHAGEVRCGLRLGKDESGKYARWYVYPAA